MAMEKNSVLGSNEHIKTAARGTGCPLCGSTLDMSGSLPRCPIHGTAPFEAGSYIRKKANERRH
jgi:hypothetical protein